MKLMEMSNDVSTAVFYVSKIALRKAGPLKEPLCQLDVTQR